MLQAAIAALRTVLSKPTRFTLLITPFSSETSWARTLTIDRIADAVVRAVAPLGTILSEVMRVTGSIAANTLPTWRAEALTALRRTRSTIHAFTRLTTVLTIGSIAALFLAIVAFIAGNTVARSIDMVARRVILAVALDRATFSVPQERTWPVTQRATPAWFTQTLAGPWMTHPGIIHIAFALASAVCSETIIRTKPQPTIRSHPAGSAGTLSGGRIANGSIQTSARLRAVISVRIARTRIQTFGTHKSWCAHALPSHVIAIRSVEALTLLLAP